MNRAYFLQNKFIYWDGAKRSQYDDLFINQKNDCSVISFSKVFDLPYKDSYGYLKRAGRKNNDGADYKTINKAINKVSKDLYGYYNCKYFKLELFIDDFIKLIGYRGNYIVELDNHVFAVCSGNIYDTKLNYVNKKIVGFWVINY